MAMFELHVEKQIDYMHNDKLLLLESSRVHRKALCSTVLHVERVEFQRQGYELHENRSQECRPDCL